ncbi:hypothetical protein EQ827_01360 [Lactobacillus bombi]|nr:hypothetical protein [Bombilactobacillus bombi]
MFPKSLITFFNNLNIKLTNGYGMTECSSIISIGSNINSNTVGKINPHCKIKIVNGTILVSGSILMSGYFKEPELTNEKIKDGWLNTEDMGFIDNKGDCILPEGKRT